MSNHPNRNWRRRMQQSADQWLSGAASVLYTLPLRNDEPARSEGLRNRLREAYLAGYKAARSQ